MKIILIIEDNPEIRENMTELLELNDFKVVSAMNGAEGISIAKEIKPDLILCDIMMPVVNGYEVLRQLKTNPPTAEIPFIYVTASAEKTEVKIGMDLGADGYIRKPFETSELMYTIKTCLKSGD